MRRKATAIVSIVLAGTVAQNFMLRTDHEFGDNDEGYNLNQIPRAEAAARIDDVPENGEDRLLDESGTLPQTVRPLNDSSSVREWPVRPEVMETLIRSRLPDLGIHSLHSSQCTPTWCEVTFSPQISDDLTERLARWLEHFQLPPFSAKTIQHHGYSAGFVRVFRIEFLKDLPADELLREIDGLRRHADKQDDPERWEKLRGFNRAYLLEEAEKAIAQTQTSVGEFSGMANETVFVERICSENCPADTQLTVYYHVPDGLTCERMYGVEQTVDAFNKATGFQERTLCVPSELVDQ